VSFSLSSSQSGRSSSGGESVPSGEFDTIERRKATVALLFVVCCVAASMAALAAAKADFEEPECIERPLRTCYPCGKGTNIAPFFGEYEQTWPRYLRAGIYFAALIWAFMGVGIVCDQFVAGIEEITSAEVIVWVEIHSGAKRKFHKRIWNATVANLSLMALGSSAPEILITATELFANDFYAGALGPATIVGSAAFNLLMISAVCISAIPAPEIRKIEAVDVFGVSTAVSIFAYLWLGVILRVFSPDRVELWEGIVTFLMFPALVSLAYAVDVKLIRGCKTREDGTSGAMSRLVAQLEERTGKPLPAETVRILAAQEARRIKQQSASRAELRRTVTRAISGGSLANVTGFGHSLTRNLTNRFRRNPERSSRTSKSDICFGFKEQRFYALECAGIFNVSVVANRQAGQVVEMRYYTKEGTAKAGKRFRHVQGTLIFGPRQMEKIIKIPIIDNDIWDPDEEFYVHLENIQIKGLNRAHSALSSVLSTSTNNSSMSSGGHHPDVGPRVVLGCDRTTITVLNDDDAGMLSFDADEVQTREGMTATICVARIGGSNGRISCQYETLDGSAVCGKDYEAVSGELVFESGERHKTIEIPILVSDDHEYEDIEEFKVVISKASPGVQFNSNIAGCCDSAVCDVVIAADNPSSWCVRFLRRHLNRDRIAMGMHQWREQFSSAFYCNGTPADQSEASPIDWFFHLVMLIWKLTFALVPPPYFLSGWACFWAALAMIGGMTAFVGDVASLLGCCVGMPDEITAITLVALGTSLPDTLASKAAAQQDDTADNSVGNIMGSNSVNVFLGLGISWTAGAAYWHSNGVTPEWRRHRHKGQTYQDRFLGRYPEGGFMVPADDILFSVVVYSCCSLFCVSMLVLRRRWYGGELGGPRKAQQRDSCILAALWTAYVTAVSIHAALLQ